MENPNQTHLKDCPRTRIPMKSKPDLLRITISDQHQDVMTNKLHRIKQPSCNYFNRMNSKSKSFPNPWGTYKKGLISISIALSHACSNIETGPTYHIAYLIDCVAIPLELIFPQLSS